MIGVKGPTPDRPPVPAPVPPPGAGPSMDAPGVESSDPDLIARALANEERAWRVLVDRYSRLVYSIPKRASLPDDACDDVYQEVFTIIHRSLGTLRDVQSLPKWIITTTTRETWRFGRKLKAARGRLGDAPAESPDLLDSSPAPAPTEPEISRLERQQLIHEGLQKLGGKCEQLLRAIFLDRDSPSYDTISARVGIPVGSIGPTRARCLAKLAALLGARLDPT
jgi:RNA polymerase sigma factor (sigma-70 family)